MKLLSIITLALVIVLCSCQNSIKHENQNDTQNTQTTFDSVALFLLNEKAEADSLRKVFLKEIDEIEIKSKKVESYRFTWSRAFHGPMMYTIEENDKGYFLKVISVDRKMTVVKLKEEDWNEFRNLLRRANYWNLDEGKNEGEGKLDGSYWTLEGSVPSTYSSNNKYHIVTRFSPKESAYKNACLKLIELDSTVKKQHIY